MEEKKMVRQIHRHTWVEDAENDEINFRVD